MSEALATHLEAVLRHALGAGEAPAPLSVDDDAPAGAFVALTVDGALRGLLGSVAPRGPFVATAAELVRRAVTEDPRFEPPAPGDAVTLTVYRVGPSRPVAGPGDIVAGREGVMVREGFHRAVHLPTGDDGADPQVLLESACIAAGLHPEAFSRPDVRVEAFEVERVVGPPLSTEAQGIGGG